MEDIKIIIMFVVWVILSFACGYRTGKSVNDEED